MAFPPEPPIVTPTRTPTALGQIAVTFVQEGGSAILDAAAVRYQVFDGAGRQLDMRGHELLSEMTPGQITSVTNFLNTLRAKIATEAGVTP